MLQLYLGESSSLTEFEFEIFQLHWTHDSDSLSEVKHPAPAPERVAHLLPSS
jgi:hypothetical protein